MLIKETSDRGIEFIYAIAPGLDIVFSNDKDTEALKNKLEQVREVTWEGEGERFLIQ